MAEERLQRRLAAILSADVVGYSRLMGIDEAGTLARLKALRRDLIDPNIAAHSGRIVKLMGDGVLVEFGSAVDAVACAIEIQKHVREHDAGRSEANPIQFRVGINVGDIIIEGDDIFGDGVNIAARIESVAAPGGISLSEDAWRQVQGKVAANFVDSGEQSLKNIARPVRVYRVELGGEGTTPPTAPASALPDKPSIAVLPFTNMSGDAEQDYFCDGLVEDIITTLSKLAGLRVIARNSSFVYKGRSVDVREAAKQLGVRYVLEGSVRKSGNRIRITAQLIDAKDGTHLWAERYDRAIDDIFAIQDEITLVLATEMQVKLTEGEQARLRYTTTHNVEAWTYWAQGMSHYRQAVTKEKMGPARLYWEKALALDPNSASLNAMLGFMHCLDARFGWWDDRETAIAKATAYADRALEIDPRQCRRLHHVKPHSLNAKALRRSRGRRQEGSRNWRPARPMQRNLPASFSRRRDIPKKRSYRARKRSPLARTIPQCIWALSEMPIACRGEPSKRLPPSMRIMREAPDLALPIS